jgi:hypothetical protein
METSRNSNDTSQTDYFYNGTLYPGQKLCVPEPSPSGLKSSIDSTLTGWSRTEYQGTVKDREESWTFHDAGQQPTMWVDGGPDGLLVIDRPGGCRRVARKFQDIRVNLRPGEVIISQGWTFQDGFTSLEEARLGRYDYGPWEFRDDDDYSDAPDEDDYSDAPDEGEFSDAPDEGEFSDTPDEPAPSNGPDKPAPGKGPDESAPTDGPNEPAPSKGPDEPAELSLEGKRFTLAHPILHSPSAPQDTLPYKEYT